MFSLFALMSLARADILPPPSRPDWDDPEPPLPEPPDDVETVLVFVAAASGLILVARRWQRPKAAAV